MHWWVVAVYLKGLGHEIIMFLTQISLKVHKHEICCCLFCKNRNLMVPRACNTRFLKIIFDSAEIFDF